MCDDSAPLPQGELLKDGKMLKWRVKRWFWIESDPPCLVYSGGQGGSVRGSYPLHNCYCRSEISGSGPDRDCAIVLMLPSGIRKFFPAQELGAGERERVVEMWVDALTYVCNRVAALHHMQLQLKKHIGSGLNSHVYLALRQSTGDVVACKITDKQRMGPESADMLETEAAMHMQLLSLGCDRILKLLGANIKDDPFRAYLVTEFCSGGEVFEYATSLPADRFNERMVAEIMRSVLQCVHVMHSNGFVHRDLKLENVLLSTRDTFLPIPDRVKVADFGFICRPNSERLTLQCGTPAYWAPEIITASRDNPYDGCPVDMWSLGVMLFVLLTSSYPFNPESDDVDLENAIKSCTYDKALLDVVSQHARSLVFALLELDPAQRLTVSQALQHPFITQCSVPDVKPSPRRASAFDKLRRTVTVIRGYQRVLRCFGQEPSLKRTASGQRRMEVSSTRHDFCSH
jgi:serine/threonine protein kinase